MTFTDYYLVREREFFVDLTTLTDEVIDNLQHKISKKKAFNSGDKITVNFGEFEKLDFKFYKGYSKAARETGFASSVSGDGETLALYFPKKDEENARIEIYVNASKKGNSYYKEKTFEDFMNKSLPKYIKDILRHEIAHAYEDLMMDTLQHSAPSSDSRVHKEYINDDKEINANLSAFLSSQIKVSALVKYYVLQAVNNADNPANKNVEMVNAVKTLLNLLSQEKWVQHLTNENKKWIIKTTYTFVQDLVDRTISMNTVGA